eukprot:SAG11_NODE_41681_length_190_cov_1946.538462_1_plen_62_part_11
MLQIQGNPEQRHDLTLTHADFSSSVKSLADIDAAGVQNAATNAFEAAATVVTLNNIKDHLQF